MAYSLSVRSIAHIFFFIYLVFFLSTLKHTLGLTSVSTIMNILLFIIAFILIARGASTSSFDLRSYIFIFGIASIGLSALVNLILHWSYLGLITVSSFLHASSQEFRITSDIIGLSKMLRSQH